MVATMSDNITGAITFTPDIASQMGHGNTICLWHNNTAKKMHPKEIKMARAKPRPK